MKLLCLIPLALSVFGCAAADQAANDATQATLGSADRAKEVAGRATTNVKSGEKTLEDAEAK